MYQPVKQTHNPSHRSNNDYAIRPAAGPIVTALTFFSYEPGACPGGGPRGLGPPP